MDARERSGFDAIVIGSGMGGLACGCALTRCDYRVLVLEKHSSVGGLTQSFSRNGFRWAVGVHYLGDMGEGGAARKVLDWLSGATIRFVPTGPVYDTVHLPEGFEFQFVRPQEALIAELKERFPASARQIDRFFLVLAEAERAGRLLFAQRVLPAIPRSVLGFLYSGRFNEWWGRTTQTVLTELISDPRLRAVLAAQRGDYGPDPVESSFGAHAGVMRHYINGAYFPLEGADAFAARLVPVIKRNGGEVRTRATVVEILLEKGAAVGVRLKNGETIRCPLIISDIGARNTVAQLLPEESRNTAWSRDVLTLRPSACHVALYLGFNGEIASAGATSSNHWFYETYDIANGLWRDPLRQPYPPALYVTFPSMKFVGAAPSPRTQHTAEIVVFTDWSAFAQWADSHVGHRPAGYLELKETIKQHLLAQFARHFPALASRIAEVEVSTPLSTADFTGADQGAMYGLEASPRRFFSKSLQPRTPIPGLYLTGQDVCTGGVTGAMMGGILSAAAVDRRLLRHLS